MEFHATVLEVLLIAVVGGYIGFILGLRSGAFMAASRRNQRKARKAPTSQSSKVHAGERSKPSAS